MLEFLIEFLCQCDKETIDIFKQASDELKGE